MQFFTTGLPFLRMPVFQEDSLFYQVLVGLVNTLTTILALLIIDKVGRKKLIYYGVSGMVVSLILIGSYFLFGNAWNISSLFLLAFFLCYVFVAPFPFAL